MLLADGAVYSARALILATGSSWRRLGVPGERELTGFGVAYCSTCDAPLFKDKDVVVVGGGNSGIEAALDLLRVARFVTVIEYADRLKADDVLQQKLSAYANQRVVTGSMVTEILGQGRVQQVRVQQRAGGEPVLLDTDGVFIEIGLEPNTGFCRDYLQCNAAGEIVIDAQCRTSREGVFAAGDATSVPYKQIIIAAGEGAKAGLAAWQYIVNSTSEV